LTVYQNQTLNAYSSEATVEAQPGFCLGKDLKMKNFCDIIFMTYFR